MIATSLLGGCVTAASDVCPPVVPYSEDQQKQAAAELGGLPRGTILERMLADYAVMRDQARACGGAS